MNIFLIKIFVSTFQLKNSEIQSSTCLASEKYRDMILHSYSTLKIAMKISERGQITIPRVLREKYGLLTKTEVQFIADKQGLRLVPSSASGVSEIESLYGRKKYKQSTDELMSLPRD